MQKKRRVIAVLAAAVTLFSLSSTALADDTFLSVKPLIADVTAISDKSEVIIPHFIRKDVNTDGIAESMSIRYDIFANNSLTKLYSTTAKFGNFPAVPCTTPLWAETYHEPTFVRSGNWVATGNMMVTECQSQQEGNREAQNAFIYVANVGQAGGAAWILSIPNALLKSLELVDYNGDGINELVAMMIVEADGVMKSRILAKNIQTGVTVADKTYVILQ